MNNRYRYYHMHPRDIRNECSTVRVRADAHDQIAYLDTHTRYIRISRRALAVHIAHICRINEAWGSNADWGGKPPSIGQTPDLAPVRCDLCGRTLPWAEVTNSEICGDCTKEA